MKKIYYPTELSLKLDFLRKKNKKIVLCHGVFDLLHSGHINHFQQAKEKGDILVVSITDDKFVNKGPGRPAFTFKDRAQVIASLSMVDYVTINQDFSSINIIKKVKPNVYCKGSDYLDLKSDYTKKIIFEKKAVESIGGKICFTTGHTKSSSRVINKYSSIFNESQKIFFDKFKNKKKLDLVKIFNELKKLKVLIIGEIILDKYVFCEPLGKSGKESILTFRKLNTEVYNGGSLAVANHLSSFVSNIDLISYVGKNKSFLNKNLSKNIHFKFIKKKNTETIEKTRFVDHLDNRKITGIYNINDNFLDSVEEKKIIYYLKDIKKYDLVIVVDYGHGLITEKIAKILGKKSKYLCVNAQVNSANIGYHSLRKYSNAHNITINGLELRHETKDRFSDIRFLANKLKKEIKAKTMIVTQGKNGAFLLDKKNKIYECPAFATKVVDKVGSGDVMFAISSILLNQRIDKNFVLLASSLAAGLSVETIGNSVKIDSLNLMKSIEHILK
jgi:rfaE bifunctional protein kinase chain/domain/rfaE bifunctional protein nucleotidyltransferase chain/domain